jgi:hypothetical protein
MAGGERGRLGAASGSIPFPEAGAPGRAPASRVAATEPADRPPGSRRRTIGKKRAARSHPQSGQIRRSVPCWRTASGLGARRKSVVGAQKPQVGQRRRRTAIRGPRRRDGRRPRGRRTARTSAATAGCRTRRRARRSDRTAGSGAAGARRAARQAPVIARRAGRLTLPWTHLAFRTAAGTPGEARRPAVSFCSGRGWRLLRVGGRVVGRWCRWARGRRRGSSGHGVAHTVLVVVRLRCE